MRTDQASARVPARHAESVRHKSTARAIWHAESVRHGGAA